MVSPVKLNHGNRMTPIRDNNHYRLIHTISSPKKLKSLDLSPVPNHRRSNLLSPKSVTLVNNRNFIDNVHQSNRIPTTVFSRQHSAAANDDSESTSNNYFDALHGAQNTTVNITTEINSNYYLNANNSQHQQPTAVSSNNDTTNPNRPVKSSDSSSSNTNHSRQLSRKLFSAVLKNELLDRDVVLSLDDLDENSLHCSQLRCDTSHAETLLQYTTRSPTRQQAIERHRLIRSEDDASSLRRCSRRLIDQPQPIDRSISSTPYKILDAPDLQDDFYLNLIDWSNSNLLAVGLGSSIYLWHAESSQVTCLGDLADQIDSQSNQAVTLDSVTSVKWSEVNSQHLAVGSKRGQLHLWDVEKCRSLVAGGSNRTHLERIGVLSWRDAYHLWSGSRDRSIAATDLRQARHSGATHRVTYHTQEVCGLEWSSRQTSAPGSDAYLASGGNDNQLCVWPQAMMPLAADSTSTNVKPLYVFSQHQAAVKAIGWSKTRENLLASGGGTVDRYLRIWDVTSGTLESQCDTGSQVCALLWSKNSDELVTAHGYSKNHVAVWQYPELKQIATLSGHSSRVLFLTGSPCGQNIVSGAGDETLRFWSIFEPSRCELDWQSSFELQQFR